MSQSIFDFPLDKAREIADKYIELLRPYCTRIEIAGSVRREKSIVHDIEIVAVPVIETNLDMFGNVASSRNVLDTAANDLAASMGAVLRKNGPKFKQFGLAEGLNLDLFLVTPPAHWGVIYLIRTGSADFSHRAVMTKRQGGMLPSWAKVEDGQIKHRETGEVYPCPEEQDYFNLCDINFVNPKERI